MHIENPSTAIPETATRELQLDRWNQMQKYKVRAAIEELYGQQVNPFSDIPEAVQNSGSQEKSDDQPNKYQQANEAARERHDEQTVQGIANKRKKRNDMLRKTGKPLK